MTLHAASTPMGSGAANVVTGSTDPIVWKTLCRGQQLSFSSTSTLMYRGWGCSIIQRYHWAVRKSTWNFSNMDSGFRRNSGGIDTYAVQC